MIRKNGAEPGATDNAHSCHGSCCARSAPAAVMSDLKRSAKSESRNIEFWSANYRHAYESPKKKEVAGLRKRRGEAIAIKKNHQHEETEPTHMKVSSLRKNTELNQSLQTMQFAVTPAASHPSRQQTACLI
jgi:hypothetical protein